MISLETFNKYQLKMLIESERFASFPFLPITVHRAMSHIHNPHLDDEQVLLILAFDDGKLAGYLGILVDVMQHQQQKISLAWLSTIFVHHDFRGKKIAQLLIDKACELYDDRLILSEFTSEGEKVFLKSHLFFPEFLKGKSYHFLSQLELILPTKNPKFGQIKPLLRLTDTLINSFVRLAYKWQKKTKIKFEIVNLIDEEIEHFIQAHHQAKNFYRSLAEIKWITQFPWILPTKNLNDRDYHFSDFDPSFKYHFIKIFDENNLVKVILISVRNQKAKLNLSIGQSHSQACADVLYELIRQNKIINFICFDDDINQKLQSKFCLFSKERHRKFLIHKSLKQFLGDDFVFDFPAQAGDAIFT